MKSLFVSVPVYVCENVCKCTVAVFSCRLSRQHGDLGASLLNELLQVDLS